MNVRAFRCRSLLAALLPLAVAGCKTWEPATSSPRELIRDERPSSIRVTTPEGRLVTLRNPMVVNDSIVSVVAPPANAAFVPPRVGVAANDVGAVEVARLSPARTIVLVGAIVAASVGWARINGAGGGREDRGEPLPKDPALSLTEVFRILWRAF